MLNGKVGAGRKVELQRRNVHNLDGKLPLRLSLAKWKMKGSALKGPASVAFHLLSLFISMQRVCKLPGLWFSALFSSYIG